MVDGERGKLKDASAGKIGERAGRVLNKRKMAKHFSLQIADGSFDYRRNELRIVDDEHTFARLTTATELQASAFELLGITPK